MQDFKQLKVWRKAHDLALQVYRITSKFPREELFGLTAQVRRSAASVPANIAEGCGRNGAGDFARFCAIALGSASETEYHLILARDLKILGAEDYQALADQTSEVKRMLTKLVQRVNQNRKLKTDN
ncbi:MAG: four helix bundle protein [Bryobacterales bacterium]|nr:four helix bundle protein [Bryobacterales bacterium]